VSLHGCGGGERDGTTVLCGSLHMQDQLEKERPAWVCEEELAGMCEPHNVVCGELLQEAEVACLDEWVPEDANHSTDDLPGDGVRALWAFGYDKEPHERMLLDARSLSEGGRERLREDAADVQGASSTRSEEQDRQPKPTSKPAGRGRFRNKKKLRRSQKRRPEQGRVAKKEPEEVLECMASQLEQIERQESRQRKPLHLQLRISRQEDPPFMTTLYVSTERPAPGALARRAPALLALSVGASVTAALAAVVAVKVRRRRRAAREALAGATMELRVTGALASAFA